MQDLFGDDDKYDEEWKLILSTKGIYTLSKWQALIVKQAFSQKEKTVIFDTFVIPLAFVAEFYRVRRFLKDTLALPSTATDEEYKPIAPEKWEEIKKKMYEKIGKTVKR